MDPVLLIFSVIALLAFSVLCVVATMWILDLRKQVTRTIVVLDAAGRDITDIKHKLLPVLDEAKTMLTHAANTFEQADIELEKIGRGADTFIAIAEDVRRFEQHIVDKVQGPIDDVTSVLNGVMKGVSTFARQLLKR